MVLLDGFIIESLRIFRKAVPHCRGRLLSLLSYESASVQGMMASALDQWAGWKENMTLAPENI